MKKKGVGRANQQHTFQYREKTYNGSTCSQEESVFRVKCSQNGLCWLTCDVEVSGLFQKQVNVSEGVGDEEARVPHEVEDVSEHAAIPVDEVVLLQGVQDDGDAAIEQFGQSGVRVSGTRLRLDQ